MYIGISRILFDRKMQLKLNAFVNLLKRLGCREYSKRIIFTLYFMTKVVLAFVGGLGLFALIPAEYYSVALGAVFIMNLILKLFDGGAEYKQTFVFPFDRLRELSIATEKRCF